MRSTQVSQKFIFVYVTLLLLLTLLFFPTLLHAQTTVPFAKRFETQGINGELTMIGNSILGENATQPYNGTQLNNNIDMVFIDIDQDASTFNSSSAKFSTSTCNRVVYAGLYWGAMLAPATPAPNEVKFKIPGKAYQDLTADAQLDAIYYKDVTSIVQSISDPSGTYFVANVSTEEGYGLSAGWTLVLVYEDPTLPRKFISTFDGFSAVRNSPYNSVSFSYSGFTTPPSGPVEGKVGVVAMEGDLGLYGDHMQFKADGNATYTNLYDYDLNNPTQYLNDPDNFFNSKITDSGLLVTSRNPASTNTLGWDQKILDLTALNPGNTLIGNGETGATVRVTNNVGGDHIYTFLNTFSINIIEPTLQVLTSVEDTSGNPITLNSPVQLGATVWYNINFQNIGTDNALNTEIKNTLPINVTLDQGSIQVPAGVTYTYNSTTRELIFSIPDNLVVRESDPNNAAYDIRYQVTASDQCFDYSDACTNVLVNSIESYYDGETSGQNVSGQPGLNGINGCGLGNVGSMDLYVDTSSCQFDTELEFCNNTITISGDDGYNVYEWVDQNGNNIGNTKEIGIDGPGIYTVTQTKTGCTVTTRVVTVNGLDVTFTPSDNNCKDSADGSVAIQVNESSANFTYELLQGTTTVETYGPTSSDSHTFAGLDIGNYKAKVTNADGCYATQTFNVSEPTLLQASNTVLDNIMPCNGNTLSGRIEISATGGTKFTGGSNEYEYSMDGGAFQTSNIFETTQEGNHSITVRDAHGCTATTVANIDFDEEIVYNITKEDVVCQGDTDGKITVNVTSNTAGNTLSYSIDGGVNFQSSPVFNNKGKGDYQIIVRKVKGVNSCETVNDVTIDQLVYLEFEATGGFSCEGATNTIIATVADQYKNDVKYKLDNAHENTTGIFENVSGGDHIVSVEQITTGCSADPITIHVEAYTPITINDVANVDSTEPNQYTIAASGGLPGYQYAVYFLGNSEVGVDAQDADFVDSPVFDITQTGYYNVHVRDEKGCDVDVVVYLVYVDLFIPNFFTPNGDGINDTWYPRYIAMYPNITVDIFDRYQRLIVHYQGNQHTWDGTYNGKLLPSGDYWYVVKLNDPTDNREFKGNFTLYRDR